MQIEISLRTIPEDSHLSTQIHEAFGAIAIGEIERGDVKVSTVVFVKESAEPGEFLRRAPMLLDDAIRFLDAIQIWIQTPLGGAVLQGLVFQLFEMGRKYLNIDLKRRQNKIPYVPPTNRSITIFGPNGEILKHEVVPLPPDDSFEK